MMSLAPGRNSGDLEVRRAPAGADPQHPGAGGHLRKGSGLRSAGYQPSRDFADTNRARRHAFLQGRQHLPRQVYLVSTVRAYAGAAQNVRAAL